MTDDPMVNESDLVRDLNQMPVAMQRPVFEVRYRGRRLRNRRRAAMVAAAMTAMVAIGTPSLALINRDADAGPADRPEKFECLDTHEERFWSAVVAERFTAEKMAAEKATDAVLLRIPIEDVHDDLRWIWPQGAASPPTHASAHDDRDLMAEYRSVADSCPHIPDESISLVWLDSRGKAVKKTLTVARSAGDPLGQPDEDMRTVGTTKVGIGDHPNGRRAVWNRGGETWSATGDFTIPELEGLVRSVEIVDGKVELNRSELESEPDHVAYGITDDAAEHTGAVKYEVTGNDVGLEVDTTPVGGLWSLAFPGVQVAGVAGKPALVVDDGKWITWQPERGLTLRLYSNNPSIGAADLQRIAERIKPVDEGDERLDNVWTQ